MKKLVPIYFLFGFMLLIGCKDSKPKNETISEEATNEVSPLEKGRNIAMQTMAVLGKNLAGALNTKGTEDALSFCSTRAISLTDSMSVALSASIKRVSDKSRNPANAANPEELNYIKETKSLMSFGKPPKPKIKEVSDGYVGYYPILTNQMCIQCHGQKNTEIKSGTLAKINEHYPNDMAVGYLPNELRGLWVVEFAKE